MQCANNWNKKEGSIETWKLQNDIKRNNKNIIINKVELGLVGFLNSYIHVRTNSIKVKLLKKDFVIMSF